MALALFRAFARLRRFLGPAALRCAWLYLGLYYLAVPSDAVPPTETVARLSVPLWDALVPPLGQAIGVPVAASGGPSDGSDTAYEYLRALAAALVSALGGLLWLAASRRAPDDARLARWLEIAVRWHLGLVLMTYGFAKLFGTQFPPLPMERMLDTYGQSSPMGLLWTFMAYSPGYGAFTGAAEVLAGALLVPHRTSRLGALIGVALLGNIVALNLAYDVPVKLYSAHLLLLALAVLWSDLGRLTDLLVRGRPCAALAAWPRPASPLGRRAWTLAVAGLIAGGVALSVVNRRAERARLGLDRPEPALHGLWEAADGPAPWKTFVVNRYGLAIAVAADGTRVVYGVEVDPAAERLRLRPEGEGDSLSFRYQQPSPEALLLIGDHAPGGPPLAFRRRDPEAFLLLRRGFHWVNESPLNE